MHEYARDERRKALSASIGEALDFIRRGSATGIAIQTRDGGRAYGDWARTSNDRVTVYGNVMGTTHVQTALLDDVLVVETVWSDVTPPLVAPNRFDACFDQALLDAFVNLLGKAVISDALKGDQAFKEKLDGIEDLMPWQQDEERSAVIEAVAKVIAPVPGLALLDQPVMEFVDSEREIMRRHVTQTVLDHMTVGQITYGDATSIKTMRDLADGHPDAAVPMLIDMLRIEIHRQTEPYMPLDRLRYDVDGALPHWFERRAA